ncbi:hypothetical protein V1477_006526 [Vespula maculifrons]|uniref:Uncharacterized protein n=1 Tax=Vespula maculifrons TaxID=7453 RepID=A0ABD2CK70_VESMC
MTLHSVAIGFLPRHEIFFSTSPDIAFVLLREKLDAAIDNAFGSRHCNYGTIEFVVYRELSCFIEFQADKMRLEEPILPRAFDFLITCHKLADTLGPFQDSLFSGWPQVRSTTSVLWDELQAGSFIVNAHEVSSLQSKNPPQGQSREL